MLWFAVASVAAASCSSSAAESGGLNYEIAAAYLRGEASVEELRNNLRLPRFVEASPIVKEQRRLLRDSPGHYNFYYVSTKRDGPVGPDEDYEVLAVARLADYEAERYVLDDRVDLAGTLADFYEPAWYAERYLGGPGPFRDLGHGLSQAAEDHFRSSRLSDLLEIYAAYDRIYCFRLEGIAAVPALGVGLSFVTPLPDADNNYLVQAKAQSPDAPFDEAEREARRAQVDICEMDAPGRLWPLPYDAKDAWEYYRVELRAVLASWLEENQDLVPAELTIER